MPTIRLTHRTIAGLTAGDWLTDYWDELLPGFGVRVSKDNSRRSFVVRYSEPDGTKRRVTLGSFPELGLADARDKAREILATVQKAKPAEAVQRSQSQAPRPECEPQVVTARAPEPGPSTPAPRKRAPKEELRADGVLTFGELATIYIERHAKVKKRTWRDDERNLKVDLLPAWKDRPAESIRRRDVAELLDRIVERGAPILANRVKALTSKIFNVGIGRGLVENNPATGVAMPAKERQRDRVLSEDEIRAIWRTLDAEDLVMAASFKLRLLTAQRGDEVLRMKWADIADGWWTIPAEVAKNGLTHRVPLSPQAIALLDQLQPLTGRSPWVFASPRKESAPITAIQKAAERIARGAGADFVPHDLRRTAASFMTSMGISRLVVSKILNHVESGITAVYDRHSYDAEKRQALETWGRRVEEILQTRAA